MVVYRRFKLIYRTFVLVLLIAGAGPFPAEAQTDLFSVKGIKVDVTAENALAAREQAFEQARKNAFKVLAERMLTTREAEAFTMPDLATISSMIQDYEVTEEKLSNVRYIGTYTLRFNDKAVRRYFSQKGVDYTDVASRAVLILPFSKGRSGTFEWSPYQGWVQAWQNAPQQTGLVPVAVPLGDLQDLRDIGESETLLADTHSLERLKERYNAAEAVLAVAGAPGGGALDVDIYRTDRGRAEYVQTLNVPIRPGESDTQIFMRAVDKVRQALKQDWKRKTVTRASEANRISVYIPLNSLEEWVEIQDVLGRVHSIDEYSLQSLSPRAARIHILFQGREDRLNLALRQADMTLTGPHPDPALRGDNRVRPDDPVPMVYKLTLGRYNQDTYRNRF